MEAASLTPAPMPTMPQHMRALARANEVRLARAALKREIAAGKRTVAEVIEEVPWQTESMTLIELLTSQRSWGRTRARKFLVGLMLPENKRLGSLTARQRMVLIQELESPGCSQYL